VTADRILVLGTGAMGCAFTAWLARAGNAVTLAGTWAETLSRAADPGITVEDESASWTTRVDARHRDTLPARAFALTLVLVKAHQTESVAPIAAAATAGDGLIVTLQNGWGNREILQASAPGRVCAGTTVSGIAVVGPARVRGRHRRTVLGAEPETETRVRAAAARLNAAGITTEVSDAIDGALWLKLAINCAINPLSALLGRTNGELSADPESRETLAAAAAEAGAVAHARGTPLAEDPVQAALAVARATAANRSSMLQDTDRGATTEVDQINGAVCREGRRVGVPTPVNDRLWRAMRGRQGLADPLPGTAA
jgi:2-dehydropantoate 2-reductase